MLAVIQGLNAFLFFFPFALRAAGLLLETSQAVRKTVMPRGRSECRVRAESVVAPQHSRSPPCTSTRGGAGISERHLALEALWDGADTEPAACCSAQQHNRQTICFHIAVRRPACIYSAVVQQLDDIGVENVPSEPLLLLDASACFH